MNFIQQVKTDDLGPTTRWDRLKWRWSDLKHRVPYGYRINQAYWKIKRFFVPARPRLLKAVGKDWRDCAYLVPHFLFECVIDFVEEEKPFQHIVWPPEEEAVLRDLYDFVKVRMPAAEKEIQDAQDKWFEHSKWAQSMTDKNFRVDAATVDSPDDEKWFKLHCDLEQKLEAEKIAYMKKIVEFSGRMWT